VNDDPATLSPFLSLLEIRNGPEKRLRLEIL
jgi:hypothetical protein